MSALRRPTLEAALAAADLTVLVGPAGYGKTTTVRNALADGPGGSDPSAKVVWVNLGSMFRTNASTVAVGLVDAACRLGAIADPPDVAVAGPHALGAEAVDRLGALFTAIDGPATVVVDDLHRVGPTISVEVSMLLSAMAGDGRHLVLSTRSPISKLATNWPIPAATQVIGVDRLRFEHDEIAALLGPDLGDHVERVASATNGWPVAVDVMRRQLARDPAVGFEQAVRELEPFIAAEVLSPRDGNDLDVLMAVSLLESFSARLADRAAPRPGASVRLEHFADETGLLIAADRQFTHVPLFRHALRRRLESTDPAAVPQLHVRTAEAWLDEPSSVDATINAIHHLIEGRAYEQALHVISRRWADLYTASRIADFVALIEEIPLRYWVDDAGHTLVAAWANLLIGRGSRALALLQSPPLRTPVGAAIRRLVWAQGVFWSADPAEAMQLVAEGRARLDALPADATFPYMPGNDDVPAYRVVADGAEARARFLIGDLDGAARQLDELIARPTLLEPISIVGLHAVAALVRAVRGDRHEAMEHLRISRVLADDIGVSDHYVLAPSELARFVLATLSGDDIGIDEYLPRAIEAARSIGAANLLRICELVADLAWRRFGAADAQLTQRASRFALVDSHLPSRAARRLADLGDVTGAEVMLRDVEPTELNLASWIHVSLRRHPQAEVRRWLDARPPATCAHGQVIRLLAEATVAESPNIAQHRVRRAVALASERRLLGVVCDAPSALWERPEIARLDLPLLVDARRRLAQRRDPSEAARFTQRELELLRLLRQSSSASEIADRLFVSVNTVKWHKANTYRKLGVSGSRSAVERAIELGLIDGDDLADRAR